MNFSEDFLHFVWKYRLFDQLALTTVTGESLRILHTGHSNTDAGPDFYMAKVEIDGVEWIGNVEIHITGRLWNVHRHQDDAAYNNVILHVVLRHDINVKRSDHTSPFTLALEGRIFPHVLLHYQGISQNKYWISCEQRIHRVDPFHIQKWSDTLLIERLLQKSEHVYSLLAETKGDWETTAFRCLASCFGFKTNTLAFDWLARSIPISLLSKFVGDPVRMESVIFGQAGFLDATDFRDAYPKALKSEYEYLKNLYRLKPLHKSVWKFSRMRPNNFPTIRLAQFAAYCVKNHAVFQETIHLKDLPSAMHLFHDLSINPYWETHFQFDKESATSGAHPLGSASIHNLIINFVVILLFSYGRYIGDERLVDRAMLFLEALPPEDNYVVRGFKALGISCRNAAESQARLQLKTIYCEKKRCLDCGIGLQVIKYQKE